MDYLNRQAIKLKKRKINVFFTICVIGLVIGLILGVLLGSGAKKVSGSQNARGKAQATTTPESTYGQTISPTASTAGQTTGQTATTDGAQQAKSIKEQENEIVAAQPWNLTFVNKDHGVSDDYKVTLANVQDGMQVDKRIKTALNKMLKAGKKAGMNISICSAYRDKDKQTQVFNDTMKQHIKEKQTYLEAYQTTCKSVMVPGYSEHALGLAVDLVSTSYTELDEKQAETKEAKWLAKNCAKYGFILRYPPEKSDITGVIYEPWHFRYVGEKAAAEIMEKGETLEEYLGIY